MSQSHSSGGVTVLELMIVVAIIAIFAALAMPSYQERYVRNQVSDAITLANLAKQAVSSYYTVHQALPSDNAAAGLPPPDKIVGTYVASITVQRGAIDIEFGNDANRAIKSKHLSLRPAIVPDYPQVPIAWVCARGSVPGNMIVQGDDTTSLVPAMVPPECRAH